MPETDLCSIVLSKDRILRDGFKFVVMRNLLGEKDRIKSVFLLWDLQQRQVDLRQPDAQVLQNFVCNLPSMDLPRPLRYFAENMASSESLNLLFVLIGDQLLIASHLAANTDRVLDCTGKKHVFAGICNIKIIDCGSRQLCGRPCRRSQSYGGAD
ncbi:MAG: hypothetical protein ACRC1K_15660 [Planctomycetia bacterium]